MTRVREVLEEAVGHHRAGRLDRAELGYREVLRAEPRQFDALHLLGALLHQRGRHEEAARQLRQALALRGDSPAVHYNLGAALAALGRPEEALASYREAARLRPDYAEAHNNLGTALKALGRVEEALASYGEALRLRPDYPEARSNLGNALLAQGRVEEALASYREALRLRPDYPEAHNNLGAALEALGRPEEALASYREAVRLRADYPEAHNNVGAALEALGRPEEALASYREAVRLRPDYADAHHNLGLALLLLGDMKHGWPEYEWRWRRKGLRPPDHGRPAWDGSPLAGRTILLWAEQGLGDTLQLVRYAPLVKRRGGTVLLACQPRLLRLLRGAPGVDQLVSQGGALPSFDVHASLMNLPGILGTTLATIPAEVPYLSPEPELVRRWSSELGPPGNGLRVGIAWQGNPDYKADRARSVPLREFGPLGSVEGVRLFSLQKGFGVEQLTEASALFPVADLGARLDGGPDAFVDTAAVLRCLDLVVTSDSALAHLAGALGVPVWLALPLAPDWRWLLGRQDSPWYPTMRLFRQRQRGDWPGVFHDIADAARQLLDRPGRGEGIRVEVSAGELVDKITILEIKSARLTDPAKLENVRRELATLRQSREQALPSGEQVEAVTADLRAVNERLWDVEDEIRLCEARGDFGPRFVELARSVYHQNDHRAALKRRLNELVGSRLVEEKSYADYQGTKAAPPGGTGDAPAH